MLLLVYFQSEFSFVTFVQGISIVVGSFSGFCFHFDCSCREHFSRQTHFFAHSLTHTSLFVPILFRHPSKIQKKKIWFFLLIFNVIQNHLFFALQNFICVFILFLFPSCWHFSSFMKRMSTMLIKHSAYTAMISELWKIKLWLCYNIFATCILLQWYDLMT